MSDEIQKHAKVGLLILFQVFFVIFCETFSPWFWGEIKQFHFNRLITTRNLFDYWNPCLNVKHSASGTSKSVGNENVSLAESLTSHLICTFAQRLSWLFSQKQSSHSKFCFCSWQPCMVKEGFSCKCSASGHRSSAQFYCSNFVCTWRLCGAGSVTGMKIPAVQKFGVTCQSLKQ